MIDALIVDLNRGSVAIGLIAMIYEEAGVMMTAGEIKGVLDRLIKNEGGYVNDPADAGGETNFGITIAVARQNGYAGSMRIMTEAQARSIYWSQYVVAPGYDKIGSLSVPIAYELVDTGVNMGVATAGRFLQRALNLLVDGVPLVVDGEVGQRSRDALAAFLKQRGAEGERRLLDLLNAFQGTRYAELAEARPANRKFMYGWLARIAA